MLDLTAPEDTLARNLARPLMVTQDRGSIPCTQIAKAIKTFQTEVGEANTSPEASALAFYGLNHAVAALRTQFHPLEPLPGKALALVHKHFELNTSMAFRMFAYLLLICTREARHVHKTADFSTTLQQEFGPAVASYVVSIDDSAQAAQKMMVEQAPDYTLGEHCRALQFVFYKGGFAGGYGGKKWGQIADCLSSFVHGETSAEIMLDTAYTLSHNNGPIFNKGMLFSSYSGNLIRILDVQRSGQIPRMILHDQTVGKYVNYKLGALMLDLVEYLPEVNQPVDWYTVEALGAVQKYTQEKAAQAAAGNAPANALEAEQNRNAMLVSSNAVQVPTVKLLKSIEVALNDPGRKNPDVV